MYSTLVKGNGERVARMDPDWEKVNLSVILVFQNFPYDPC